MFALSKQDNYTNLITSYSIIDMNLPAIVISGRAK